jgi:hypothetical protein
MKLQKDGTGNVITYPVTGWLINPAAQIFVLATIQYAQTPQELETGVRRQIQFALTPQLALDLAEELKRTARSVLESLPGSSVQ